MKEEIKGQREINRKREIERYEEEKERDGRKKKREKGASVFLLKTNPYPITRVVHYFINNYNLYKSISNSASFQNFENLLVA